MKQTGTPAPQTGNKSIKSPIILMLKKQYYIQACLFYLLKVLSDEKESELSVCTVQYDSQELILQLFLYNQRKA